MQEPVSPCKRLPAIDQMFLGFRDRTNRLKINIRFVEAKKIATNDMLHVTRISGDSLCIAKLCILTRRIDKLNNATLLTLQ